MRFALWITCVLAQILCCSRVEAQYLGRYDVQVTDPSNSLGYDRQLVLENLSAALDDWARYIPNLEKLQIEVNVTPNTRSGRFSGRAQSAVPIHWNGMTVLEECTTNKLRTGVDSNGDKPDVLIELQPDFMRKSYWIDPHPERRTTPVPRGKIDLVTVFAHELGHAFGINGRLDRMTGSLPQDQTLSEFDAHIIYPTSNQPAFRGQKTNAFYGRDLPLTYFSEAGLDIPFQSNGRNYETRVSKSQNYYHYGRYTSPGESPLSLFGLMAGGWPYPDPTQGLRIPVGKLDVAILQDLGVPVR